MNGGRGDSTVKEVVEEAPNEGSPPELFATDDLVEVLLKHNKLLGRLHQFTAPNTDPSIPTSRCISIIYIVDLYTLDLYGLSFCCLNNSL